MAKLPNFYWYCFNCFQEAPEDYAYSAEAQERDVRWHIEEHEEEGEDPAIIVYGTVPADFVPHHPCAKYPLGWELMCKTPWSCPRCSKALADKRD